MKVIIFYIWLILLILQIGACQRLGIKTGKGWGLKLSKFQLFTERLPKLKIFFASFGFKITHCAHSLWYFKSKIFPVAAVLFFTIIAKIVQVFSLKRWRRQRILSFLLLEEVKNSACMSITFEQNFSLCWKNANLPTQKT